MALVNLNNDTDLIRRLSIGDRAAFESIYHHYFNSVYYFAARFIANTQKAEDITTEAFLKCWEKRMDFDDIQKLRSFLYTTTRNACINELRSEKRQTERERNLAYLLEREAEDGREHHQIMAQVYQYIYEEIEKLPRQEKNIFKMAYLDGMSNAEIAAQLDINNQSVRNYKARALKSLRMAFAEKDIFLILVAWIATRH